MPKKTIGIVGSGFGGLTAAIRLQAKGYQTILFEKNEKVGGHASAFTRDGYTFDMGPSLITAPEIIEEIFESAGVRMEDRLDLIRLDPAYRIYFHDGSLIDYTEDPDRMREQLASFNPADGPGYDRFMKASKGIYEAVILDGLGSTAFDNLGVLTKFLPRALKLNALLPAYTNVTRFFKDERSRFTFSFHPLFIGGNPFRAPSVYQMIPYLEREGGVWFTKGGMYTVVKAFEDLLLELGGEIRTSSPVEQIHVEQNRAKGVVVNGETIPLDAVISNADWMHTNRELLNGHHKRKKWTKSRLNRTDYSMGAYLLYLGVKKQYPQLKHHTLILSPRYRELVRDIFDRKVLPDDFSMYLHVPTRTDPGMAPEGSESMYVLIPVANLASGVDWDKEVGRYTDKVINFLENDFGLEGLRENIEVQETFTPKDFERERNSYLGSAWGVEPKLTQTANFRPHNRHEDVRNLYLVGASTHPGAGLPGVMLTAKTTEALVINDLET
ncbi:phytoene desaturase [bacterium]|nr:phytoene desaturase [bacterium]